jgi:hypothetical protein
VLALFSFRRAVIGQGRSLGVQVAVAAPSCVHTFHYYRNRVVVDTASLLHLVLIKLVVG